MRLFLIAFLLLAFGIILVTFNVSEFQRSYAPDGPDPLDALEYFMLAWFVTFIGCVVFFPSSNKLLRYGAMLFAGGALLALVVNAYYFVKVVQSH